MKTTVKIEEQPKQEIKYPCLLTSEDGQTIVLAVSDNEGTIIADSKPPISHGHHDAGPGKWSEQGYKPIFAPVTITFHPTE